MSFSVDDLVSSFSSSHIGQEASDLAALQAQLAEALFGSSSSIFSNSSYSQRGRDGNQMCTTPTARTPSLANFNVDAAYHRSRSSSISSRGAIGYEDVEDEMMVEELLMPASSAFENTPSIPFKQRTTSSHYRTPSINYDPISSPTHTQSQPSHFTSSDPFYLQAQANAQSYFYENSNITQYGRPSVSSPFVTAAATQFHGYQYQHPMGVAS